MGGPILRAGSKYLSPAIKRQLAKIIPAVRSGAGRVAPESYKKYPSGPVRKEKYPWMEQGIKGKWPRGKKGETPISIPQRPGTTASYEDRGRMLLGDVIGNVKPLVTSGGIGGLSGLGAELAFGEDEEAGAPTSVGGWNIGEVGTYTLPSGEEVQMQVVGFDIDGVRPEECPQGVCWALYDPEGSGKPRGYQTGAFLGDQEQDLDLYNLLVKLLGDRASRIDPLDIPELGTQERYSLEEILRQQLPIPDLMESLQPETASSSLGLPSRLPEYLVEESPLLRTDDLWLERLMSGSGDQEIDPSQEFTSILPAIDTSDVSRRSPTRSSRLEIRSDAPPIDIDGLPQVRPDPLTGIQSTAEGILSTLDNIMGARDYIGGARELMGEFYPEGQERMSDVIRARMEEYDTLSEEDKALIALEEELIGTRYDERGELLNALSGMAERHEDPSSLETYLMGQAEMAPEFQKRDMMTRSLAGVADSIAGNIFPGDLGRGLSALAVQSADTMQANRILNENRYREIFTAEEDRERLHDELRAAAIQAEIGSEQEKDAARLRLAQLKRELTERSRALEPSLMQSILDERGEASDMIMRMLQLEGTDRAGILNLLSSIVGGGGRAGSGDTRLEIAMTIMGELRDEEAAIREGQQYWPDPKPSPGDSNYPQYQIYLQRLANLADLREQLIDLGIDPDQDQSQAGTNPAFDFRPPIQ